MFKRQNITRKSVKFVAIIVTIGLAITFGVKTWVRAQTANEIIHACVAQVGSGNQSQNVQGQANTGSVRIVSSSADCKNGEYYIEWNSGSTFQIQIDDLQNQINGILDQFSSLQPTLYKDVSAGNSHTCFLRDDDSGICFGVNYYGQLDVPVELQFISISPSFRFIYDTCSLTSVGRIKCWGQTLNDFITPEGEVYKQVVSGPNICGLKDDSTIKCWDPYTSTEVITPTVEKLFTQIAVGGDTYCGIESSGSLFCWGSNASTAMDVPGGSSLKQISMSESSICGVTSTNQGLCWGITGDIVVPSGTEYKMIDVSVVYGLFACGLRTDGKVECWGNNDYGQLNYPTDLTFSKISLGAAYGCGIVIDGSVQCWGDNYYGQAPRMLP